MGIKHQNRVNRIIGTYGDEVHVVIHVIARRSLWRTIKSFLLGEPCPYAQARQSARRKHYLELCHGA